MSNLQTLRTIKTLFKKKSNLYEFYINDSKKNEEEYLFKDNRVDTKKYNIIKYFILMVILIILNLILK